MPKRTRIPNWPLVNLGPWNADKRDEWQRREDWAAKHGMKNMFARHSLIPPRPEGHKHQLIHRATCNLCDWHGYPSGAWRHAKDVHGNRLVDLRIRGTMERYKMRPK